ncbi:hypothetical protein DXG01_000448 [Tephrocybe rancida]|nr:hypothetical protein DXG01_000448 [Tephrocybe rancida]
MWEQPFKDVARDIVVLRGLDQGKIPERPGRQITAQGLNDDLWSLMRRCWHKKPESRPTMTVVKNTLLEMRGVTAAATAASMPIMTRSEFTLRHASSPVDAASSSSSRSKPPLALTIPPQNASHLLEDYGFAGSVVGSSPGSPWAFSRLANSIDRGASLLLSGGEQPFFRSESESLKLAIPSSASSLPSLSETHFSQRTTESPDGHSTPRSNLSLDSGIDVDTKLHEAATETQSIVHIDKRIGTVSSGTLEGLIDRLISGSRCTDFTTLEALFGILARRFHEAEAVPGHPEDKVAVQHNIFSIIRYWLTNLHLSVDPHLLWHMKTFCAAARSVESSIVIHDEAEDLLRLIDNRAVSDPSSLEIPLSPGRRIPRTSEITPNDLAVALTLLEGDRYRAILPTDYIAHLSKQPRSNNVQAAYLTNNKIVLWVKQSLLHYDTIDARAQVLKFFVNTAVACLNFRNFSSATAISNALHSAPIDRLRLTKKELSPHLRHILDDLEDLLDPSSNHKTYRVALRESSSEKFRDRCIPWIAVHLRELFSTLQKHPTVVKVDGIHMINFERYIRFTDRVKEVLHYMPPDLERYRQQGQLAYLEHQLRKVHLHSNVDEDLMKRSTTLEAGETRDYRARKRELKRLGFRTS